MWNEHYKRIINDLLVFVLLIFYFELDGLFRVFTEDARALMNHFYFRNLQLLMDVDSYQCVFNSFIPI